MTLPRRYDSMLASPSTPSGGRPGITVEQLQASGRYLFQKKYDGVRAQLSWDGERARLVSRHNTDLTAQFPDIIDKVRSWAHGSPATRIDDFVVDGELVPRLPGHTLADLLRRVQSTKPGSEYRLADIIPAQFVAFDLLVAGDRDYVVWRTPFFERMGLLDNLLYSAPIARAHTSEDGVAQLDYQRQMQGEGIVAKLNASRYTPGVRSWSWIKFKITYSVRAICYGPSGESGNGTMLAMLADGQVRDVGSVGAGMRDLDRTSLQLAWKRGEYPVALIDCLGVSKAGRLRQPVFRGFLDEPLSACDFEQQQELPVST